VRQAVLPLRPRTETWPVYFSQIPVLGRRRRPGNTPIFKRILPRDHWLSGRDWRNRERQRALDRTLVRSGRYEWILFNMLERLEGRQEPAAEVATA
jgi:hypothetical protein